MARQIPVARLRFATFITADCPIDELRYTVKEVSAAGRTMLKRVDSLHGWFMRQEVYWHTGKMFHSHLHVLLDTRRGYQSGRNCMSVAKWTDRWLSLLPEELHNVQSPSVKITRMGGRDDDFTRTLHYLCKSPWEDTSGQGLEGTIDTALRVTDQIKATARLRRYASSGTLSIRMIS